jgi:hypothetical protein
MGRAGQFSPFDDGMKAHLVANSIWRTCSVLKDNWKPWHGLNYYCQLFALFWVVTVLCGRKRLGDFAQVVRPALPV